MRTPITLAPLALILSAALAACSTSTPAPAPTPTPPPAGDTTPPSIVSVSPADGASGVAKDASVVISFSEPMNQASAQAAFQSASLGGVTFSWNAEGTVMTVKPNTALTYTSAGQSYSYMETTTATDRAGNALASPSNVSFKTLREITATLNSVAASEGEVFNNNTVVTGLFRAGDASDNAAVRGFTSFDLSGLPAGLSPDNIEKATLRLYVNNIVGHPFTALFPPVTCAPYCFFVGKSVVVDSVHYGATLSGSDFDMATLPASSSGLYGESSGPILLLGTTTGWNRSDVSAMVRADWQDRAARGSLSQYRLKFPLGTNADNKEDRIYLDSAANSHKPQLVLTYLIP